jgi:hypothetical protein
MNDDSVQFLSNIAQTQWATGKAVQHEVNAMLSRGWTLLAAGMNPYGEPCWLLGLPYGVQEPPQ